MLQFHVNLTSIARDIPKLPNHVQVAYENPWNNSKTWIWLKILHMRDDLKILNLNMVLIRIHFGMKLAKSQDKMKNKITTFPFCFGKVFIVVRGSRKIIYV